MGALADGAARDGIGACGAIGACAATAVSRGSGRSLNEAVEVFVAPERRACGPGVITARAGGAARSDMRFPQFVQKMIPAGFSHPQLPQRILTQ